MAVRESGRKLVTAEVGDPDRPGVGDQRAQQAAALRPVVDGGNLFL
jgi:hypothetical protein